ncbi:Kinesin-like protein kif15 [Coemansia aciculifera]|nr:Kinesin-like protein kif15 [Coemansia aciculifera]
MIRNKAVVNQDMQGNVPQLQAEIQRLKLQLAQMRAIGSNGMMDSSLASSDFTVSPYPEPTLSSDAGSSVVGGGTSELLNKGKGPLEWVLLVAMRKMQEAERQRARYAEVIFELKNSLDRHRRQLQHQKMVLKLAKAESEALRRKASVTYVASAENNALREEITALQHALSTQPDSADLAIENVQLREDLEFMLAKQTTTNRNLPDPTEALEAIEALLCSKFNAIDLKAAFPIIPDDAVYMGLEAKLKQSQHDINDLELQRDKLEFQLNSTDEDWQCVNEGTHKLSTATTDDQVDAIIEKTMDGIVGDHARDTWSAISTLFTRTF